MRWPRPSLVRRLTFGFAGGIAVAFFLFFFLAMYPFALIEEDEPIGPEVLLAYLEPDLRVVGKDGLALQPDGGLSRFRSSHPGAWFIAQAGTSTLTNGPVPAVVRASMGRLPGPAYQARFRGLGSPGPKGEALTQVIEIGGKKVTVTAGGVDSQTITFGQFVFYMWANDFLWVPILIALFNLAGALIAIPIILRSVRPTARAASELDPAQGSRRLPEQGVVKELLPIVRAFNEALDRLSASAERRKRFIADVAHELRTPLAILNMHVETLPEGGAKPDLQRSVFRLGQMVGQMLDAERLVLAGRRQERVDLVEIARSAVADAAPLAISNGYELAFAADRPSIPLTGDAHAIGRAVANLIGNAVAHGGGSGAINVRVHTDLKVDVADEGPGIPLEAKERIFEPFHRERWDRDGCGLGLHLVREIMEAHGGSASLIRAGPGAVFRLDFAAGPHST